MLPLGLDSMLPLGKAQATLSAQPPVLLRGLIGVQPEIAFVSSTISHSQYITLPDTLVCLCDTIASGCLLRVEVLFVADDTGDEIGNSVAWDGVKIESPEDHVYPSPVIVGILSVLLSWPIFEPPNEWSLADLVGNYNESFRQAAEYTFPGVHNAEVSISAFNMTFEMRLCVGACGASRHCMVAWTIVDRYEMHSSVYAAVKFQNSCFAILSTIQAEDPLVRNCLASWDIEFFWLAF
ncbi:uncharacterized protein EAE97_008825 [Botrytis byssoidea]|uniref:Uncharacterized protein n=1 Tax=Botrytis byssoidea TaxID=139641 RepID=A0A9P5I964_9HELO|nr:uncharacterized protein EAE97_008825 [Botrytis byssoidea]KAF7933058.1 hypothetical protein EAE97_008825 [Botrytis byssoidea]